MADNLRMAREGTIFTNPVLQLVWPRGKKPRVVALPEARRNTAVRTAIAKGYLVETDEPVTEVSTARPGPVPATTGLAARTLMKEAVDRSRGRPTGERAGTRGEGLSGVDVDTVDLSEPGGVLVTEPAAGSRVPVSLDTITKQELQALAEELGLPADGTKQEIADRIRASEAGPSAATARQG